MTFCQTWSPPCSNGVNLILFLLNKKPTPFGPAQYRFIEISCTHLELKSFDIDLEAISIDHPIDSSNMSIEEVLFQVNMNSGNATSWSVYDSNGGFFLWPNIFKLPSTMSVIPGRKESSSRAISQSLFTMTSPTQF